MSIYITQCTNLQQKWIRSLSGLKWNDIGTILTLFFYSLVIVAEVTQPSLGVGYELGRAVAMGKRILCLYRPQENKRKFTPFFTKKDIMPYSITRTFFSHSMSNDILLLGNA